jgi:hypothetical protein
VLWINVITVTPENFGDCFSFEKLNNTHNLASFTLPANSEYAVSLHRDALRFQCAHISNTFLLIETATRTVAAYISLITDAVKLEDDEKNTLHIPDVAFETLPAAKIAKLAVDATFGKKYRRLGSLMLNFALAVADECNDHTLACRVLTVDADIEHDPGVTAFYEKNGFIALQNKKYIKRTKTVPMWTDIFR